MKKMIWTSVLVPVLAGCITTTVDKGKPKMGQTVERPHPAEETAEAERANSMQQAANTQSTVVPGDQGTAGTDNSIFTGNNTTANNVAPGTPETGKLSPNPQQPTQMPSNTSSTAPPGQ